MKKLLATSLLFVFIQTFAFCQSTYLDSMNLYIRNYVDSHEVVKNPDRNRLRFFPINESYRVIAQFTMTREGAWFQMPTSGPMKKIFREYGTASFKMKDTIVTVHLYQSQSLMENEKYRNLLFLPFTDATTGVETYEGGRYIDLSTDDIHDNTILIDFNKAYNPYCAYVSGKYNCPIPPAANHLAIAIRAGEMAFTGQ
jgi:uncharacterized protein